MTPRPPTHRTALADAAARRTLEAERRVQLAMTALDRDGESISFASVAHRAQVSRGFLYSHADFRAEIEALRSRNAEKPSRLSARHRGSEESLRTRLRAALEDNRRLREEITQMREELAIAHGRARELELDRRARR